jgi:hypothetical protein
MRTRTDFLELTAILNESAALVDELEHYDVQLHSLVQQDVTLRQQFETLNEQAVAIRQNPLDMAIGALEKDISALYEVLGAMRIILLSYSEEMYVECDDIVVVFVFDLVNPLGRMWMLRHWARRKKTNSMYSNRRMQSWRTTRSKSWIRYDLLPLRAIVAKSDSCCYLPRSEKRSETGQQLSPPFRARAPLLPILAHRCISTITRPRMTSSVPVE